MIGSVSDGDGDKIDSEKRARGESSRGSYRDIDASQC